MHCSSTGTREAVKRGQLEVVRYLDAHGVGFPEDCADLAVERGDLAMMRQLGRQESRDPCTPKGADEADWDCLLPRTLHGNFEQMPATIPAFLALPFMVH